jgi:hypothetical protein
MMLAVTIPHPRGVVLQVRGYHAARPPPSLIPHAGRGEIQAAAYIDIDLAIGRRFRQPEAPRVKRGGLRRRSGGPFSREPHGTPGQAWGMNGGGIHYQNTDSTDQHLATCQATLTVPG